MGNGVQRDPETPRLLIWLRAARIAVSLGRCRASLPRPITGAHRIFTVSKNEGKGKGISSGTVSFPQIHRPRLRLLYISLNYKYIAVVVADGGNVEKKARSPWW